MALVISSLGIVSDVPEDQIDNVIWDEGYIHIRRRRQSVIMYIAFDRLTGPAVAAALYELADMQPNKVCLVGHENRINDVLVGFRPAFKRICDVFSIVLSEETAQTCSGWPAASEAGLLQGEASGWQRDGLACGITEASAVQGDHCGANV